jgi:GNAT superfamily N-acetyltransferase
MIQIHTAKTANNIQFCTKALLTFRPMLKEKELVVQTLRMMAEGFKLIYIADEQKNEAAAVLGYRDYEMYRTGRIIYVDDLFTFPEHRGKGYAGALLDYVHEQAATSAIASVHLDSGYPLHPAHRLYLNKGYVLPCLHFAKSIELNNIRS